MYLRSLTIRGFKSFASSTTLNFEPGITCVVGPNGSGKSNVVDALSWVMGEQGAKTLRGGKMEDVIFAGTSQRAPLGRAEVILTIDNTDGALPIDYTEVTISRTMFRSGGSEYAINGNPARLLDIQELLSDSGIGREMHVIVGQGQLDSVLQATPEIRRQFIEEAAGVLKHRKRKEKALRKLEATDGNLTRLQDLLAELRRQLKPLGRQAEVARKAAVIQAEVRDAKSRLLADDLLRARQALADDVADEARLQQRRHEVETALTKARELEAEAEAAVKAAQPQLLQAQETWYYLSSIRERVSSTRSIAGVKLAHANQIAQDEPSGKDPEAILAEAKTARAEQAALQTQVEKRAAALKEAATAKETAEAEAERTETEFAAQQQAIADRREGLARLTGEVNTAKSRLEAAEAELERLAATKAEAEARAEVSKQRFAELQLEVEAVSQAEPGLDDAYEKLLAESEALATELATVATEISENSSQQTAVTARLEALKVSLDRKDGSVALLDRKLPGIKGKLSKILRVKPGYEAAISTALGLAAESLGVVDLATALTAFEQLQREDLGRASVIFADAKPASQAKVKLSAGQHLALDLVTVPEEYQGALSRLLANVIVVPDLSVAQDLVTKNPELIAVTLVGEVFSTWFAQGGSTAKPSSLQVQAEVDLAQARLAELQQAATKAVELETKLSQKLADVEAKAQEALQKLHASDAAYAAITDELNRCNQQRQSAEAELNRIDETKNVVVADRQKLESHLAELEARLARADAESDVLVADPTARDKAAKAAMLARQAEMEARLALRTLEERVRAIASRAESLERSAADEQENRRRLAARRAEAEADAKLAQAVLQALDWLETLVKQTQEHADQKRQQATEIRGAAEIAVTEARERSRELAKEFEQLVAAVHKDEMARTEQRIRLEQFETKALEELGIEADILIAEFGPDQPVPVLTAAVVDTSGSAETIADDAEVELPTVPYDRLEQEKRLKKASRDLETLGKINPLALEEFEAMQERHGFLAEQLDDLKKTRADLLDIIKDVDARVEEVFAQAYADVSVEFENAFARLFPGGDGRLVLTEPDQWLTTGVDVEARPPGKKVKRLSLLSGGERALVAVAFLVALFKARPSPFYILDEVEAALDDTNLGRLLDIYEELRANSQLLVITHQKRTMEIADALYGITMRKDGVSTVISQRLRDE